MEYSGDAYDKATVENDLTDIAGGTISEIIYYTQDGQQTTPENSGASVTGGAPVNKGSYKVKVKYDSSSYSEYVEESFEITKAANEWIEKPAIEDWTYGDEANTPEGKAKYGSVSVTYAKAGSDEFTSEVPTEAGNYTIRFTVEGTDNYSGLSEDAAFTIAARSVTVKVDTKEITYGDAEPEYTSRITDGNLVNGDDLKLTYSREQGTTAKTYEITVVSANNNYKVTVEPGTLTIQKKDLIIAPMVGQKKIYGDTDPQFQYSVSGLINEEKADDILTGALARIEGENKGKYAYEIGSLADVSGNYNVILDEDAAAFEITAREVILTWSETKLTFNGSDQSVTATVSNPAFDTDSFTLKYTGNIATDAGNYKAEVIELGNDNYVLTENSNQSMDWMIAKAQASCPTPEVIPGLIYSGEDQALVKATNPVGGTLMYKVDDGEWSETIPAGLDAGTYRISYKVIGDKNHEDSPEGQITAVIAPKSIADAEVKLGAALGYTGEEQTQTVAEVKLDGTVLPADTYEILNATQTEAGVYTLTIRAKENGNYTDSVTCTYVIAPTKAEQITEDEDGNVKVGNGTLSLKVKTEDGAPDTSLGTTKEELIEMLIRNGSITADELSQMADGARMDLILTVKDASATISDEAREQMIQAAGAYQIGQYMDITLFKYMTISGVTGEGQQLHETDGMITISVKVPDNLLNTNKGKKRTYCIIRNHNGIAEVLNASFDATTQMLTFQTNRFSDYAIAYKDTKKSSGSHKNHHRDDNTGSSAGTSTDTGSTVTGLTSPKTGDTAPIAGCVMLFIVSLAAAAGLLYMRKKDE